MLFGKLRKLKKPNPEAEKELREQIDAEGGLEKNDMKAMIIAALLVIMPVAVVVLLLFALLGWLLL